MKQYTLQIPENVERQFRQCRASFRQAIQQRLQQILAEVTAKPRSRRRSPELKGPPLRFYIFEGYRVSYEVNPLTRSVTVLGLRPAAG